MTPDTPQKLHPFAGIIGHQEIIRFLQNVAQKQRLPNSYLFIGPDGIGKILMAQIFAQYLNCLDHSNCASCYQCKLFLQKQHPDYLQIKAETNFIKIGQIHTLIDQVTLKPAYAVKRVIVLENAHQLNIESANAFLKFLEEPPLNTLIILTSSNPDGIIETIKSRCQPLFFAPLKSKEVQMILQEKYDLEEQYQELVLNYGKNYIRDDFIQKAETLFNLRSQALRMISNLSNEALLEYFAEIEILLKEELTFYLIEFLLALLSDILLIKDQMPPTSIINSDLFNHLKQLSFCYTRENLEYVIKMVYQAEQSLNQFANKKLILEALLLKMHKKISIN